MNWRPIQVQPRGLLGFLQLKNLGKNPENLPDTLQPVLEQLDWYLQTNAVDLQRYTVAQGPGAVGFISFTNPSALIVPANQWWYVDFYTIRTGVLGAGDGAQFACGMVPQPAIATGVTLTLGDSTGQFAGPSRQLSARAQGPFWAPPGAELVIDTSWNSTAATINYTAMVRYTPLPI